MVSLLSLKDSYGEYIVANISGHEVLLDKCDEHILNRYWRVVVDKRNGYKRVISSIRVGNGKRKMITMSRFILNVTDKNIKVDHVDGNTLNNRRHNIRKCTNQQNAFNQKTPITNKSGTKGVHWYKNYNKWVARITINGKKIHLGYFDNIEDAIIARKNAEDKYQGDFKRRNLS